MASINAVISPMGLMCGCSLRCKAAGGRHMTEVGQNRVFNVLFICTGNSARSIIAEAVLNRAGQGRFRAFSAGSQPKGLVHPYAIDLLERLRYGVSAARSKSWTEFVGPNAPKLDFAFTLCADAAAKTCPVWPGQPMKVHWGLPDPAAGSFVVMQAAHQLGRDFVGCDIAYRTGEENENDPRRRPVREHCASPHF